MWRKLKWWHMLFLFCLGCPGQLLKLFANSPWQSRQKTGLAKPNRLLVILYTSLLLFLGWNFFFSLWSPSGVTGRNRWQQCKILMVFWYHCWVPIMIRSNFYFWWLVSISSHFGCQEVRVSINYHNVAATQWSLPSCSNISNPSFQPHSPSKLFRLWNCIFRF